MGKGKAIIVVGCVVTLILFATMCYLMRTVNPPPLPETQEESKDDQLMFMSDGLPNVISETYVPERTDNNTISSQLRTLQRTTLRTSPRSLRQHTPGLISENHIRLLKHSMQKVVPPVWPPIRKTVKTQEKRALNKTGKFGNKSTSFTINDTSSVIKRSVNDVKQIGRDLNSIVLKIIDDSGQFNIEIKIGLNDGFVKKKNETRQGKIQSKDKSKYSIFLTTKDKTNLAKSTIISVMPNDFVTVDEYDNHLEAQNKIKINTIQASTVDFNNNTKYNITENKATVMPIYRDVLKPIGIFYNQTNSIYNSDTNSKINEKRNLLEKPNDEYKMNYNSFETANATVYNTTIQSEKSNNTAYNFTIQIEKEGTKNKEEELLEKPKDVSNGRQTNVNSPNTAYNTANNLTIQSEKANNTAYNLTIHAEKANNTAYNLTIQTEKGGKQIKKEDLLEKHTGTSDRCHKNVKSPKTANNTVYNLTIQTEEGDKESEKKYLLGKPNDVNNGHLKNLNNSNTANNTAYNLTIQAEKANNMAYNLTIQTEKGDKQNKKILEKPNDVNDGYLKNLNISYTANNTANNLTTHTEKEDKKTKKVDLLVKPNDASDGYKTNLNSFKASNNTAYNLTIQTENTNNTAYNLTIMTENTKLQYYVVTTRKENTTVDAENSTITTKSLDET